jgi:hypothetical protein
MSGLLNSHLWFESFALYELAQAEIGMENLPRLDHQPTA